MLKTLDIHPRYTSNFQARQPRNPRVPGPLEVFMAGTSLNSRSPKSRLLSSPEGKLAGHWEEQNLSRNHGFIRYLLKLRLTKILVLINIHFPMKTCFIRKLSSCSHFKQDKMALPSSSSTPLFSSSSSSSSRFYIRIYLQFLTFTIFCEK